MNPNTLSFSSIFIEGFFNESKIAIATGFIWQDNQSHFLITNRHVVTGLYPENKQPLDQMGATPNYLRVWFHMKNNLGS